MDPNTLHTGHLPSLTQVLRTLKRQENSLFNCVASCINDAEFVTRIAGLYATLPTYANLRCGLWYLEHPQSTCYFKSTDGHNGNWSFSTTRLNMHVAEDAALKGGCVIVDATRRGKTFPDALTKTVPIWAAVLNRAVKRLREQQQQKGQGGAAAGRAQPTAWTEDAHLATWISDNERHQIRLRLEGWVDQLLEVDADLSPLLRTLRKPLRCIWISQESRIWNDEVVDTSQFGFTPLVLVSASLPNARERRQLSLTAGEGGLGEPLHVMYDYVPGAGDDEESWARGLTPALMWQHKSELLAAGLDGIEAAVARLQQQQQRRQQGRDVTQEPGAAALEGEQQPGQQAGVLPAPVALKPKWMTPRTLPTGEGQHCLRPLGCRQPAAAGAGAASCGDSGADANGSATGAAAWAPQDAAPAGMHFLGDTGLAVGAAGVGAPPAVWHYVGAVLNVGLREHPGMTHERAQPAAAAGPAAVSSSQTPHPPLSAAAGVPQPPLSAAAGLLRLPLAALAPAAPASLAGSAAVHAAAAAALEGSGGRSTAGAPAPLPRYLWLPVPHSKFERQGLRAALPEALAFVSAHLRAGRHVLIHCDDGTDTSVCTALAALLACFRLPEQQQQLQQQGDEQGDSTGSTETPKRRGGTPRGSPAFCQPFTRDPATLTPLPAVPGFGKLAVRQYLAALSTYCPQARPTRGMLKQVYNLFVPPGSSL